MEMNYLVKLYLLFTFSFFSLLANANDDPLAAAFGALPDLKQMIVSPNGEKLAFLQKTNDAYAIVVQHLNDGAAEPFFFRINEGQIGGLRWLNNKRVMFYVYAPKYNGIVRRWFTYFSSALLNAENGDVVFPFAESRLVHDVRGMELIHNLPENDNHVLVTTVSRASVDSSYEEALLLLNVMTGEAHQLYKVESPEGTSVSWVLNHKGDFFGYQIFDSEEQSWQTFLRVGTSELFAEISLDHNLKRKIPKIYAVNNEYAYARIRSEYGVAGLGLIPLTNLQADPTVISEFDKFDNDFYRDQHTGQLIGVRVTRDVLEYDFFADEQLNLIYRSLKATFGDSEVDLLSYTADRELFTVRVSGSGYSPTYFLYDHDAKQLSFLGEEFPNVDPAVLGSTEAFEFTASNGMEVSGYLTLPAKTDTPPELLVLPHGGPHVRDTAEFDWLRDYFVANGFAVYQPNFRGSSGYGYHFQQAGYGQWGRAMQQDVYDGTRAVLNSGKVASQKPCILGHSYGGYVAMMAAVEAQGLFRCAISSAGVSSIPQLILLASIDNQNNRDWDEDEYAQEFYSGEITKDKLASISPHLLASEETLPLLLLHGKLDTVVRYKHSERMFAKLRNLGHKQVYLLTAPGADHWFGETETRQILLSDALYFINNH